MARYMSDRDEGSFFVDVLKIAMGVFIGGLLAALAYEQVLAWRVEMAARQAAQLMKDEVRKEEARRLQQHQKAEEQRKKEEDAREAERKIQQTHRERMEKKERAWELFYQPSDACKADSGTMPCANAYMAARKRFERHYDNQ